jgi:lipopolysaccharide transport system ATP-binding protein
MTDIALSFDHVWKKFKKGEKYDSLRELIPAMAKGLFSRNNKDELGKREFWALKDVSFEVKKGEALGIIGPNGAGKSTILKLFSGILKPNKGNIRVNGRLSALIEIGAGFHLDLTGKENIYLNGSILGMKKKEIDKKIDEIIEFSGISDFIDTPVKRYSSGMHARLGFSIAAHVEPEILLVDEVLSVGDAGFQAKCLKKMDEVMKGGTTIVFISHMVTQVARLCSIVLVLSQGEIKHYGDSDTAVKVYYDLVNYPEVKDEKKYHNKLGISIVPLNSGGEEINKIPFGTPIYLKAKCNIPDNFPESYLIIKIGNDYGQNYITLNSEKANISVKAGYSEIICRVDNCNFLPNVYKLRASLFDIKTGKVFYSYQQNDNMVISMPENDILRTLPTKEYAVFDVPSFWQLIE